jgi:hypothetical protein
LEFGASGDRGFALPANTVGIPQRDRRRSPIAPELSEDQKDDRDEIELRPAVTTAATRAAMGAKKGCAGEGT